MEASQGFLHDGGRFPVGSFGPLNTAPLFVELSAALSKDSVGLIAPTGIATDSFNQHLFRSLVTQRRLATLLDFENRLGIFPAVHRPTKSAYCHCVMMLTRYDLPFSFRDFRSFRANAKLHVDAGRVVEHQSKYRHCTDLSLTRRCGFNSHNLQRNSRFP
jgi:hypothetical protein